MVQRVAYDRVVGPQEGLEEPSVGVETRGVEDRVIRAQKVGDSCFELLVNVLRTADEPDGCHAETAGGHRLLHRFQDLGMVGQAQVVVGAEVDSRAVCGAYLRTLRCVDDLLLLEQAAVADTLELPFEPGLHLSVGHLAPPPRRRGFV